MNKMTLYVKQILTRNICWLSQLLHTSFFLLQTNIFLNFANRSECITRLVCRKVSSIFAFFCHKLLFEIINQNLMSDKSSLKEKILSHFQILFI